MVVNQEGFPSEALEMLAQVCCDVLDHKQTLPDDDDDAPNIKGNPVRDLVEALKFTPQVFYFATKTRGARKRKVIMVRRITPNNDHPDLSLLHPKKLRHWDVLHQEKYAQNEDIKTEVENKTCIAKRRRKNSCSDKKGIMAGPDPAPAMPSELRAMVVRDFDGSTVQFVIQKSLFVTDLQKVQNRLSMPVKQIKSDDFLSEEEKKTLARRKQDGHLESIEVDLIMPDLSKTKMMLRKWDLKTSGSYALSENWFKVTKDKLKQKDVVQIWFFRCREGKPCFVLVNLGQESASSSSAAAAAAVGEDDHQRSDGEPRSDVSCLTDQTI